MTDTIPEAPPLDLTELEIIYVGVDTIDPNEWNPNVQSEVVARATRESLQRFGFVEPVALWRPPDHPEGRYQIINGEHRHKEATVLGYERIPAVVLDVTEAEAKKLTIVLNETTGDPDVVLLGQLLADLQEQSDFKLALPYTDTELDHLLSIGQQDWDQFGGGGDPPAPPADPTDHEVTLAFTVDQHDQFRGWLVILEKEFGLSGVTEIVYEAVRRQAHEANQGMKTPDPAGIADTP